MEQKQFDLEAAKAGKPVCTRNGKKVRIICFDRKFSSFPIIGLVQWTDGIEREDISGWTLDGKYHLMDMESGMDLVMA